MDVAYYLSELLGQIGEVNVPGLGYFVQLRVDGYYNEQESVFYPPSSRLHFDPQSLDDEDALIQYIAEKKNISLASSKYFTEKYINNLRQQAMQQEIPFADLGTLYYDHEKEKIRFRPAEVLTNNPSYYGLPKLALNRLGSTSIFEQIDAARPPASMYMPPVSTPAEPVADTSPVAEPVLNDEPFAQPETFAPPALPAYTVQQPVYTPPAPEYVPQPATQEEEDFIFTSKTYDDEERGRSYAWIWITLLVLIVLAAGGLFALYKYKPSVFDRFKHVKPAPLILKAPLKHDTIKNVVPTVGADTGSSSTVIKDTTEGAASVNTGAPIDTFAQVRYEISGGAFKTIKAINKAIKNYESLGFEARIMKNTTGKLYKVTLGTYFNKDEAIKAENKILKTGKVSNIGLDTYNPPINPKK